MAAAAEYETQENWREVEIHVLAGEYILKEPRWVLKKILECYFVSNNFNISADFSIFPCDTTFSFITRAGKDITPYSMIF